MDMDIFCKIRQGIKGTTSDRMRLLEWDESLEEVTSLILTVIIVVPGLGEWQSSGGKQHSRCQTAFQSLSRAFKQAQNIWVASISAIGCSPFTAPFCSALGITCHDALSKQTSQITWTMSGFLWPNAALMQAVATVRPRSHSLTFYYVKLCSCACVNVQTVVAISLSDCSAFACGFLQLGFGYCWLTTAAHSALHIFSLPPCHSFLHQSHWKRKKEKKNPEKVLYWSVQAVFLNGLGVSQWATCLASPDV